MRLVYGLAMGLVVGLEASAAWASPDALSDAEVSARLQFIESRLHRGSRAANLWWDSWYYGWVGLTMAQFVWAIATPDKGTRIDMAIGAASSTLGVLPLGLLPFPARTAPRELSLLTATTPAERRRKLAIAESLLMAAAEDEILRRSWVNHVVSIGVSIGIGFVLGAVYDRPVSGVFNAIGGIALSELQIFTQPTAAIGDYREYQSFGKGSVALASPGTMKREKPASFGIAIGPQAAGISLSGWF